MVSLVLILGLYDFDWVVIRPFSLEEFCSSY